MFTSKQLVRHKSQKVPCFTLLREWGSLMVSVNVEVPSHVRVYPPQKKTKKKKKEKSFSGSSRDFEVDCLCPNQI